MNHSIVVDLEDQELEKIKVLTNLDEHDINDSDDVEDLVNFFIKRVLEVY